MIGRLNRGRSSWAKKRLLLVATHVINPCLDTCITAGKRAKNPHLLLERIRVVSRRPDHGAVAFDDELDAIPRPHAQPFPDFERHGDLTLGTDRTGIFFLYRHILP